MKRDIGIHLPIGSIQKLAVITSYPSMPHNDIRHQNAIALYAKKTLLPLTRTIPVDIYAENSANNVKDIRTRNLHVIRSWVRNKPLSLLKTAWDIAKDPEVTVVLIQFEFTMFGRMNAVAIFPFILALLRAAGKRIVWEQHEVLLDVSKLEQHIQVRNKIVQKIYNTGFMAYYRIIGLLSSSIIVLENSLKTRLERVVSSGKVVHISHIAHANKPVSRTQAVSRLKLKARDFHVMSFGFINWYKGSDWLVDTFTRASIPNAHLILAGGKSPTMTETNEYAAYYRSIMNSARSSKSITLTGYVPDNLVSSYFAAADLVVLPYRYLFAASGPLSLALAYRKPVILSSKLKGYMDSADFVECMRASDLDQDDLFFDLVGDDFRKKIEAAQNNPEYVRKLTKFSIMLAERRSVEAVARHYLNVLEGAGSIRSRLDIAIA